MKHFAVALVLAVMMVACSKLGGLSDGDAARVIQEQMLDETNFTVVPIGRAHFMIGFAQSAGEKEKPDKRLFYPNKLAGAEALASLGLVRLQPINTLDFTSRTYDIALTSEGEKAIDHRGQNGLVYFKDADTKVSRVVSNTVRENSGGAQNPEPRHLVLLEFTSVLTPLGKSLSSRNPDRWYAVDKGKIRAIIKYDAFKKSWGLERYDLADPKTGAWTSNAVGD